VGSHSTVMPGVTIDPDLAGIDRDVVIEELEKCNIESRPTWKPMHMQPLFKGCEIVGGQVSEEIFENGLCLPSGTGMAEEDLGLIISLVRGCWKAGRD